MTVSAIFGSRIGSYDVELAAIATLTQRLPTYIEETAKRRGIDTTQTGDPGARFPVRPKQPPFSRKNFGGWPDEHLPCIQVVCDGQSDAPTRQEDGNLTMRWQLNVFCIVSARDHAAARIVRSVYEDAIGWCLMQNRGLRSLLHPDGFTRGMNMLGESSADIDVDDHDNRTLQGTVIVVEVEVSDCLDVNAGPAIFIPDPGDPLPTYPDDPDAETVVLDETVVAVTDPLP